MTVYDYTHVLALMNCHCMLYYVTKVQSLKFMDIEHNNGIAHKHNAKYN